LELLVVEGMQLMHSRKIRFHLSFSTLKNSLLSKSGVIFCSTMLHAIVINSGVNDSLESSGLYTHSRISFINFIYPGSERQVSLYRQSGLFSCGACSSPIPKIRDSLAASNCRSRTVFDTDTLARSAATTAKGSLLSSLVRIPKGKLAIVQSARGRRCTVHEHDAKALPKQRQNVHI
jgi:hypothetical protein